MMAQDRFQGCTSNVAAVDLAPAEKGTKTVVALPREAMSGRAGEICKRVSVPCRALRSRQMSQMRCEDVREQVEWMQ